MSVKNRIITIVAAGIIGAIFTAAIGYISAIVNKEAMNDIYNNRLKSIEYILRLKYLIVDARERNYEIAASIAKSDTNKAIEQFDEIFALRSKRIDDAQKIFAEYAAIDMSEDIRSFWGTFDKGFQKWINAERDLSTYINDQVARKNSADIDKLGAHILTYLFNVSDEAKNLDAMIAKMSDLDLNMADTIFTETINKTDRMIYIEIAVMIAVIGVLLAVAYTLFTSIIKPVSRARDLVVEIEATQNLALRIKHRSNDEIGDMVQAFDRMMDKIQNSVIAINDRVLLVNNEIESFGKAAESVAIGSQNQSTATGSMAASMQEMSVSISSVSGNADDVQKLALSAGMVSDEGAAIIAKTTKEMNLMVEIVSQTSSVIEALGEESRQIGSVVQVIKDVADQTNLLALNAAIEAARAGDQGRGFAVVADEVRKLAERTAKSIDDITMMITKIQTSAGEAVEEMDKVVRQVEQEQKLTDEAGEKMSAIKDRADRVAEAIDEISSALKEQSIASQDIAKNVEKIAQMTDENDRSAGEALRGAVRLGKLSSEVRDTLNQFRV
ncbi:histidine kinase [Campylobacterota bacterium]|nr:histidine kinase [Campylobacterota bacterium]